MSKKDLSQAQYHYAIQTGDWDSGKTFEMVKSEINNRVQELLDERGIMLDEILNATDTRKIEILAWFDSMKEELGELLKQMQDATCY